MNIEAALQYVHIAPLDKQCWRVCDSRYPPSDAESIIAYVEHDSDHYEVIWISAVGPGEDFETLSEVRQAAADHLARGM